MQSLSNIYPPLQCAYQATTSPSNRKEVLGGLFKTPLDVILLNGLTCGYASYRSWLRIVLDKPLANPFMKRRSRCGTIGCQAWMLSKSTNLYCASKSGSTNRGIKG